MPRRGGGLVLPWFPPGGAEAVAPLQRRPEAVMREPAAVCLGEAGRDRQVQRLPMPGAGKAAS
jgi:hypothetical protein